MAPCESIIQGTAKAEVSHEKVLPLTSSRRYPTGRDKLVKTAHTWITGKRVDDDVGSYWRIHNKLYDLTHFMDKHPGGRDWLGVTRGTDITEAFESSHVSTAPEQLLSKFYVKDASTERNYPYTFHEDGFYRTLKRKVQPVLEKIGQGPSWAMVLIQDTLAMACVLLAVASVVAESFTLAAAAGTCLALTANCAHNFFHQRNNWRMYYFDLTLLSSYEWRISHSLSHHLFTNTLYDFEVAMLEPIWEFIPKPNKTFLQRYGVCVYEWFWMPVAFYLEAFKRVVCVALGASPLRPENLLPLCQLLLFTASASSFGTGLRLWLVMHLVCGTIFTFVNMTVAHHHPDIYHEGDAVREDMDWGLCQMDAVKDRVEVSGNLFLVATTFGDHSLHHLLPSVDHSKLPHLYPAFLETCREFNISFRVTSWGKLVLGKYLQLAKNSPNVYPPGYDSKCA